MHWACEHSCPRIQALKRGVVWARARSCSVSWAGTSQRPLPARDGAQRRAQLPQAGSLPGEQGQGKKPQASMCHLFKSPGPKSYTLQKPVEGSFSLSEHFTSLAHTWCVTSCASLSTVIQGFENLSCCFPPAASSTS